MANTNKRANLPPLADYFWIAGVESSAVSYDDPSNGAVVPASGGMRDSMIQGTVDEAKEPEDDYIPPTTNGAYGSPKPIQEQITVVRPAQTADNGSLSPTTARPLESDFSRLKTNPSMFDASKRSSQGSTTSTATITQDSIGNGTSGGSVAPHDKRHSSIYDKRPDGNAAFNEQEFDKALRKFALERENFLEDLSFSAGVVKPPEPKKPAQAINSRMRKVADADAGSPSLSRGGSLRRKISLRDLNSMRRAPSVANRAASIRTAKRMSNYNSVVPPPQPLSTDPHMHPLKRKYEPVLLDRYPPRSAMDAESEDNRMRFPDYVPMFAFPNDITIVSEDERPRSTWHSFCLTDGEGQRAYGICVLIWLPLNPTVAAALETRCEEWRVVNMNPEERELAASLGERLVVERSKLSELLAGLHNAQQGTDERETLEDKINTQEEKIQMMTDILRPVRHAAASRIEGLTVGDSGLWIPRAYGIITKDASMTSFYKEWLKAIVVPMTNGGVARVPPSSSKIGMWQPLERYVVNLCDEAPSPQGSKTQIELAVRELHMFARKEALNELPLSRNVDLFSLFRCFTLEKIATLFEFVLCEARIILLSSHTSMLGTVANALASLLYPFKWAAVFIPILPARLIGALEAPCPYIVGVEKRYEKLELPEDECVIVDIDTGEILSTGPPPRLPKQQRRKLMSLLQLAAPHHSRFGIETGPPPYAVETFPGDSFVAENPSIFESSPKPAHLSKLVGLPSTSFGEAAVSDFGRKTPMYNAFIHGGAPGRNGGTDRTGTSATDRPGTSGTLRGITPGSPNSPKSQAFSISSQNNSTHALTSTLRGKRSVQNFDTISQRRSSSFGVERPIPNLRRPSAPFTHHSPSPSTSSLAETSSMYDQYPPSVYTPSTIAASTIMPNMYYAPVKDSATIKWVEGHQLSWNALDKSHVCSICDETSDEGLYACTACNTFVHQRCSSGIPLPCPVAFYPDQVRAAFVRCFASLLLTYRKFLQPASGDQKKGGKIYKFNYDAFVKSLPSETADYMRKLNETQMFDGFVQEREDMRPDDPQLMVFEQIIMSKKNRGRTSFFGKSKDTTFLSNTSDHLWRSCSVALPITTRVPGEQRAPFNRIPAKLDPGLMREPRIQQGVPKMKAGPPTRKPAPSAAGSKPSGLGKSLMSNGTS